MKNNNTHDDKSSVKLTEAEELELGRKIVLGDSNALDKLVTANIGFVISVAKQYQNRGLSLDDLVSEGNIAMMLAAKKWNPEKGHRFIQYAVWDIRKAMEHAIAQQSGVVGTDLVAEVSIDNPCKAGGLTTYADRMPARESRNAHEEAYLSSFGYGLSQSLHVLNERERQVIMLYYGLNCDALTMAEIGEQMNLKRERVRQIRHKAERKLRKPLRMSL